MLLTTVHSTAVPQSYEMKVARVERVRMCVCVGSVWPCFLPLYLFVREGKFMAKFMWPKPL